MDRIGGRFGAHDDAHDDAGSDGLDHHDHADSTTPEAPLSPVGQDERRMQVRAYNHWAALLGTGNFPDIAELKPETLEDFGPYGVLLDFGGKRGTDDPAIRFLGSKLAEECGTDAHFKRLSDVPGRSLLSRITDHYLQILANQAPIGFEAEFVNQRGAAVLYRGILMPWSSDGATIDFVFGVINWKELADAATADALLAAIDAALDTSDTPLSRHEGKEIMDRMREPGEFAGDEGMEPVSLDAEDGGAASALPAPAFGTIPGASDDAPFELVDEADDEELDEDAGEDSEWGAGFAGFGEEDAVYSVDYGDQGLEDGETDDEIDGVVDPLADQSAGMGLLSLVSRGLRAKQSVVLPGAPVEASPSVEPASGFAMPRAYEPDYVPPVTEYAFHEAVVEDDENDAFELVEAFEEDMIADSAAPEPVPTEPMSGDDDGDIDEAGFAAGMPVFAIDEPEGLYDCLAAARELAQTARSSEDRGRKALYQAVSRAYDFSLEAAASPDDFDELLAENGLTVQDRAPMTPVVKLVFGADYDKTRLTEYATVLGYAHRTAVPRGALAKMLADADGGLKAIVQAERRARKSGDDAVVEPHAIRASLAKKLRKLDTNGFDDLAAEGPEFALVMVRRLPTGELAVLGEVPEDVSLIEKAARKLLG
jgi:hypothetical protein